MTSTRVALALCALGLWFSLASAVKASDITWFWPTYGWNTLQHHPNGSWVCYPGQTWQHSTIESIFDGGQSAGIFVQYHDVYGGVSTTNPIIWSKVFVTVSTDASKTEVFVAPFNLPFSSDWTIWPNRWYPYAVGYPVYTTTHAAYAAAGLPSSCSLTSYSIFAH